MTFPNDTDTPPEQKAASCGYADKDQPTPDQTGTSARTAADTGPQMPEGQKFTGQLRHLWREAGRKIYETIRGTYRVDKTGENILVGRVGKDKIRRQAGTTC